MAHFKTLDDLGTYRQGRAGPGRPQHADGGRAATDTTRVQASAPTILELADTGAKVLLLAHFGRPKGERHSTMSTACAGRGGRRARPRGDVRSRSAGPVVEQAVGILRPGDIAMLENTRFWAGEEANDPEFAQAIAAQWRFLRQRRVLRRAPRPRQHRRAGAFACQPMPDGRWRRS